MPTRLNFDKRFVLVSTPRSGHHAVANWILRQVSGTRCMFTAASVQDIPLRPDKPVYATEHWWYEGDTRAVRDNERLERFMAGTKSGSAERLSAIMDCYEREPLQLVQRYYEDCPAVQVLVIRNVFNTIASMIKRRPQAPFFNLEVWKSLAREAARPTRNDQVVILFDRWHADTGYRRQLSEQLQIEFTDAGRDEILAIGRGSSFDGVEKFDSRASGMDVLNRHRDFMDHPTVASRVLSDPEAVELNQSLFGDFMTGAGSTPENA